MDDAARVRALLTLYRESHYDVYLARGAVATIRIGEPAPAPIVRWIGEAGIAFYLTACNPRSHSLPPEENDARLAALRAYLDTRGFAYLEGAGHIPGEIWRERCLLVRGIGEAEVTDLVRLHEQNSIVVARVNSPSVLRIYRPDWRQMIGESADVEWA
jgi:hypothetical protein